ncbi:MAG TPA: adenosine deaminase [Anaerolineales bacterium]|nr:adenosine deaminase [Anaerolineales bacterium]HRQ91618.1 adenosine deaminase [Anaerolineales bacterium]
MTNIHPKLPLIDLHRHLDGSVRLQTILDLGREHNLPLPAWELDTLRPHVQVQEVQPGLMEFIARFKWMVGVLVNYAAAERIAYENLLDAHAEGIDYIELRFSPAFMASAHGLDAAELCAAVAEGVRRGVADTGVKANLIGIISRHNGAEQGIAELQALLANKQHFVALDLAGDEGNFPGSLFVEHFRLAREAGWHITVHAGEAAGAESIWQAVRELGATRIGHGVRAHDDPALIEYLVEHRIGVEANLTSNVQTSTVPNYAAHPLKAQLEAGVLGTINSDDPGISAITLPYEYDVAAPQAGLTLEQIHQAQRNALELAFLPDSEKAELLHTKEA